MGGLWQVSWNHSKRTILALCLIGLLSMRSCGCLYASGSFGVSFVIFCPHEYSLSLLSFRRHLLLSYAVHTSIRVTHDLL